MQTAVDLRPQIRRYIVETMLYGDDSVSLRHDTSLVDEGILDSTGVLELVMYVEEQFGLSVQSEEIVPENFDSIDRLAEYVLCKRRGA